MKPYTCCIIQVIKLIADAKKIYDNALEKAISKDGEAEKLAQTGLERLRSAIKNADTSKTIMREALTARAKAQSTVAPTVYPEEYSNAAIDVVGAGNKIRLRWT